MNGVYLTIYSIHELDVTLIMSDYLLYADSVALKRTARPDSQCLELHSSLIIPLYSSLQIRGRCSPQMTVLIWLYKMVICFAGGVNILSSILATS